MKSIKIIFSDDAYNRLANSVKLEFMTGNVAGSPRFEFFKLMFLAMEEGKKEVNIGLPL